MKFRAYLVDDEPLALKRLARLLEETGRFEIAGTATDPEAALLFLFAEDACDVVFLDIQMPGMNGFELLAALPHQPIVIFTTAFDQYALRAFEVNSIDYLLKPVDPEGLERVIRKLDLLGPKAQPDLRELAGELARAMRQEPAVPDRIASRAGERVQFIDLDRVTHFFARDKLTYAAAAGKEYCVDQTITELEQKLERRNFLRIHRATLVNLAWVREVDSWFAGGVLVRLKDEKRTELPVARDRVRALKERMGF
ncbi:MAG TPA: LytTR family DNA-binding domain-containing protein [Bryobacteraceae bacterium]|nr:LytTR family DNA-binding domain-containing protein [Bryobacteraceae bacterium]